MREIARKEDQRNIQWYYPKQDVIQSGQQFSLPYVRSPDSIFTSIPAGAVNYSKVSNFGGILDSQLRDDGSGNAPQQMNTVRMKGIQGNFEIRWGGPLPVTQDDPPEIIEYHNFPGTFQVAIVELPAGMQWTNGLPSITTFEPVTCQYRGMWERTLRQASARPFRVLARKKINLPCPRLYMPAYLANGANGTDAYTPVYEWMRKNVTISKWFKGLGKKLTIDPTFQTAQSKEAEYFIVWTSDVDIRIVGTCGARIRLDQSQLQVQPGNP